MIKSVTVTNYLNESLKMDLFRPEDSGLLVSNITGIGAPDADINTTNYAVADGSFFTSARASARTISLVLIPIFTTGRPIEKARQLTYRYFPIKHKLKLEFETDSHTLEIEGYVKQNDPDIFTNMESIAIAIDCPDPWFYKVGDPNRTTYNAVEPLFEFPFENDSLITNELEMGEIVVDQARDIYYDGEIETGFAAKIDILDAGVTDIAIYKQPSGEYIKIITSKIEDIVGSPLAAFDVITFSTVSGNRYLRLKRGHTVYNIINALDLTSTWLKLTPGRNTIYYTAEIAPMGLSLTIEFREIYQGV